MVLGRWAAMAIREINEILRQWNLDFVPYQVEKLCRFSMYLWAFAGNLLTQLFTELLKEGSILHRFAPFGRVCREFPPFQLDALPTQILRESSFVPVRVDSDYTSRTRRVSYSTPIAQHAPPLNQGFALNYVL